MALQEFLSNCQFFELLVLAEAELSGGEEKFNLRDYVARSKFSYRDICIREHITARDILHIDLALGLAVWDTRTSIFASVNVSVGTLAMCVEDVCLERDDTEESHFLLLWCVKVFLASDNESHRRQLSSNAFQFLSPESTTMFLIAICDQFTFFLFLHLFCKNFYKFFYNFRHLWLKCTISLCSSIVFTTVWMCTGFFRWWDERRIYEIGKKNNRFFYSRSGKIKSDASLGFAKTWKLITARVINT